jgi:methylthioribose-1-phosphate isomerase
MDTRSTASSSTDGDGGTTPAPDHDVGRRAFFRSFSRQAIVTVGQVAGIADVMTRGTTAAAVGLAGLGLGNPNSNAQRLGTATTKPSSEADRGYRSPYRLDGTTLYLLDQRALPDRVEELACRRGSDIAFYLRVMAARGGPLMGQLAAYGLALTAREVAPRNIHARRSELSRVARGLTSTHPASRMLQWSVERMRAAWETGDDEKSGDEVATELRALAERLAGDAQLHHAAISRALIGALPRVDDRPLHVLIHGVPGAATCGQIGTAITALGQLRAEDAPLKAWVTETRPYLEGARLAAWELGHLGVDHVVVPDNAVAYLLAHERIDAVLLGAEWIAANGDTANVIGSRAVAELAASTGSEPVSVYVCAPAATIDPATPDGAAIPVELRPGRDLATNITGFRPDRLSALIPATDVIPAERITAIVTEQGLLDPRDGNALADAVVAPTTVTEPLGAGT